MESKKKLAEEFEMKDLGLMHYFLGLEVWQSSEGIFINQGKYMVEILKRFNMLECKAMATPMESKLKLLVDDPSGINGCDSLQTDHWVIDIFKKYQTRHLFCCEHLESISCSTKMGSLSSCKTCDEIFERDYRLCSIL